MGDPVTRFVAGRAAPAVWAIGSGKGGVGKSVIAANLAVVAARSGRSVALVDADLGGANLHTLLGVASPRRTLSDFLNRRVAHLEEVMAPTPTAGLFLLSGARAFQDAANPSFGQKEKVIRHIAALGVDIVILDIGAGSNLNVLDFFLAAARGVLVVVPEPTSVENTYQFVRAAFFRKLRRVSPRERVQDVIGQVMAGREERGLRSPRELIDAAAALDPEVGEALISEARAFRPGIVANQVRTPEQQHLASEMTTACRDYFGSPVEALGHLELDPLVNLSVQERRPAVDLFPEGPFSRGLGALHDRLLEPAHG